MQSPLTPNELSPRPLPSPTANQLELDQIQGDVLLGLQKFHEQFVFFEIADVRAFKTVLKEKLADEITTTQVVRLREFQLRDHKAQGHDELLPLVGFNLGFTSAGIQKLLPGADLKDASFTAGAPARAADRNTIQRPGLPPTLPINDPVDSNGKLSTWLSEFRDAPIDGVLIITGGTSAAVAAEVTQLTGWLGASIAVVNVQQGQSRPGAERGHEHFGWLDGVSQPGVEGLTNSFPGQDLLPPGLFVFG